MDTLHLNIHYAIQNRLLIELNYNDEGVRIVEPYCFGVSRAGNLSFRVFQQKGFTASITPSWKLLSMSKVTDLKILTEQFDPTLREEYQVGDKHMKFIYVQVY